MRCLYYTERFLYFFCIAGYLCFYPAPSESRPAAPNRPFRIVAFGNSITAERKTVDKVFAQRLPELLAAKGLNAEVINAGVGGSHTGRPVDHQKTASIVHAQQRFEPQVLDQTPDLVIIGFGANDAYIDSGKEEGASRIPLARFRNNMCYMIEVLQSRGIRVILMATNGYRPENQDFQHHRLMRYVEEVKNLAKKYRTGLVNNQATFETFGKTSGKSTSLLFEDQLHPNDEGHRLIAESLAKEIVRVLSGSKPKARALFITKDEQGGPVAVGKADKWETYRQQILTKMESVMGPLPGNRDMGRPAFTILDTLQTDLYRRLNIRITAAPGEIVSAYLYLPSGIPPGARLPAMLALHETDIAGRKSVDGEGSYEKSKRDLGYGKELAQRGYIVLAPDYPSFGDSQPYDFKNDRYQSGTMKGIFNHIRCLDLLEGMEIVDKDRMGVIGHSLGGHNAIFLSAFDLRLKVTVSSCGWTQLDYYDIGPAALTHYGGRLGPFAQERYMPLWINFGLDGSRKPFEFHQLLQAIAPRAFFTSSPIGDKNFDINGVKEGIGLAGKAYSFLGTASSLQARYPDCGHEFPEEMRSEAYSFIDKILKKSP